MLYRYLEAHDPAARFLDHVAARLEADHAGLAQGRQRHELGTNLSPRAQQHAERAAETLRFLQLLCEGHCAAFQDFLRAQPAHAVQRNILAHAAHLLVFLVESPQASALFSGPEEALAAQTLAFLTEATQGPCAGNQAQVAHVDVLNAVNDLVSARWRPPSNPQFTQRGEGFSGAASPVDELALGLDAKSEAEFFGAFGRDLRCQACQLLAACLEGRTDRATHDEAARRLERTSLGRLAIELDRDVRAVYARAAAQTRLPTDAEREAAEAMATALGALVTVLTVLADDEEETAAAAGGSAPGGGDDEDYEDCDDDAAKVKLFKLGVTKITKIATATKKSKYSSGSGHGGAHEPLLSRVEVAWRGRVEAVVFPLPQEASYLPQSLVTSFLLTVDLTSAESRVAELLQAAPAFIANMKHVYACSQQYKLYTFLHRNVTSIKLVMYAFVVLLNLNVLMSPPSIRNSFGAAWDLLSGASTLTGREVTGLGITLFLGCVNFLGYFVIMVRPIALLCPFYNPLQCHLDTHKKRIAQTRDISHVYALTLAPTLCFSLATSLSLSLF